MQPKQVVVIGGGTGTFTVLSGLKGHSLRLSAIVSMADDGSSTGILRDELGVLPPGDVRQCLVALSTSDHLMRDLVNYRFTAGKLKGHSFGNLLLSALEKVTGSFDAAVEKASEILRIDGRVLPVTLDDVRLVVKLNNKKELRGEGVIDIADLTSLKTIHLEPEARVNPKAARAIQEADAVIVGPGDLYTSLIPNFLVKGLSKAICTSRAKKIYVSNLMNRPKQTDGFAVEDYARVLEAYLGCPFDYIIYNNQKAAPSVMKRYAKIGEYQVPTKMQSKKKMCATYIGEKLINTHIGKQRKGDPLSRTLIRHNPELLAEIIVKILKKR